MSIEKICNYLDLYENKFYEYSTEEHYQRWIEQFDNKEIITEELGLIFDKRFIEKKNEIDWMTSLIKNDKILSDVNKFDNVTLLNIQECGRSQSIYVAKFESIIRDSGYIVPINDFEKDIFIYIDDFMFTGSKARHDVLNLLEKVGTNKKIVYIFIGIHTNAEYYLMKVLNEKGIDFSIWRCVNHENRLSYKNDSDVFWPKEKLLKIDEVEQYITERDLKI